MLTKIRKTSLVYLSWWLILLSTSYFVKLVVPHKKYMLFFYLSVILVTYFSYLFLPFLLKTKNDFKRYLKQINLRFTLSGTIIAFILLLLLIISSGVHYKLGHLGILSTSFGHLNWLIYTQPPLVEELLFRGIIPSFYDNKWVKYWVSTLLFSSLHYNNGFYAILFSFVVGSLLFLLTQLTDSLIPSVIVHYIINSGLTFAIISTFFVLVIFFIFVLLKKETNELNNTSLTEK
ncbi:CPBP family intramembrane glutamic endopeptidase [Vagococcus hydrophili]|uniref:CPBP family intramembrane metalloprotease n=1 Tax=Vagococcus hydrophili TaxID=2714947 RepID=A0A6G8AWM9_9ENTE|nr:CPBP family intramembrane glutamic endopeptidase [Vagococcus hydrophili]QIL49464.1 CPBP family intramembrane metalloprotease [Vagococcus hydrophili]